MSFKRAMYKELPMHPCAIDIHNFSKSFSVDGMLVWYNALDSHIAGCVSDTIKPHEQCYTLSWNNYLDEISSEGATIPLPVREFIRTIEYKTAMMAKYKYKQAIEVPNANKFGKMYIVTFETTSCY